MLTLLGAMPEEVIGLKRRMVIEDIYARGDCRIYKGKYRNRDVLLVQSGLGKVRAEAAADFILWHYPVTAVISLGFGGALTEESMVGDVVLCSTLYCGHKNTYKDIQTENPCYSDTNLISVAAQILQDRKVRFLRGNSVTVAKPVSEPKIKRALGEAFGAEVVDMESYWIARIASSKQVPFLSVRAICDTVKDTLLPFDQLWGSNIWHWKRAMFYFFTQPQQLIKLFYLYRNAQLARRSLTDFADSFIAKL